MEKLRQVLGLLFALLLAQIALAQKPTGAAAFWKNLQAHCGKSYEGKIVEGGREGDDFTGKRLVMQVLQCSDSAIKVPFYVGENKSRTWIFTFRNGVIQLKHDHRHEDGKPDSVTMYGGIAPNPGTGSLQMFPADEETCQLINYACHNLWWVTLNEKLFSYNLRRVGSTRFVSIQFDVTKEVEYNERPWGWKP